MTMAIITAIAGGLWQGYAGSQQAKAQARQAETNAQIAEQNAKKLDDQANQAAENNRINAENKRRQMMGRIARQQVGIAASGLTATGSALNALADSKVEMERELATDSYNGRQQVDNILQRSTDQVNQAAQYRQTAKDYRKAGKWAWINAGLSTAFSLAGSLYTPKSAAAQGNSGAVSYGNIGNTDWGQTWGGKGKVLYQGRSDWKW